MNTSNTVLVSGKRLLNEFLRFPWKVYKDDPNWVPPVLMQQKEMFDEKRFHFHSTVQPFLCMDSAGKTVGRICAVYNRRHLDFHRDGRGFFGFFEAFEDHDIADALFKAASQWLKERGCTHIRGPANFSTNEECGLLVDGFDSPPVFMMTYNPRYYIDLLENAGFSKAMENGYNSGEFSWVLETNTKMNMSSGRMGVKKYKTYRFYEREI